MLVYFLQANKRSCRTVCLPENCLLNIEVYIREVDKLGHICCNMGKRIVLILNSIEKWY